jgi:hypothetical protein
MIGPDSTRRQLVEDVKIMSHVFLSVLIFGTLWRLATFHLLASPQVNLNHLGKAMTLQY